MGSPAVVGAAGHAVNMALSFVVFSFLDILDAALCIFYKLVDFAVDQEWKPCYCSSSSSINSSHDSMTININASGGSIVLRLCAATNRLQLDSISGTLTSRPSLLFDLASIVFKYKNILALFSHAPTTPILKILPGHGTKKPRAAPQWSDCDCKTCNSWSSGGPLYVRAEGNLAGPAEDVVFIHGFISSSAFWTETVFPEISEAVRSRYRLLAVDLLGFGRSPKPEESFYTLMEHIEMIERSVLHLHGVRRFHIVAHSLGTILALALAARHPNAVLSVTLIAPAYFPGEEGEVMRKLAPRRVWPPMAFAASMACWYSRTICLLICRQHRLWELIFRLITLNKIRTFLIEAFMCHTHNAAWHTLHNVILGGAESKKGYLEAVREHCGCPVNIIHGRNDDVTPLECSYALCSKIPRAHLNIIDGKDHITVVVGRQKALAAQLENIWDNSASS